MKPPSRPPEPRGDRRILFVSDPSSIALNLLPDPVREQDLRKWVDMLADAGVDTFDQEVFSQGWTCYWQSETFEYDRRLQHRRFLPMLESGVQPLHVLIDQSHRRGMSFVAGFRINDNHAYQSRQQGVGIAGIIESHPEWRLVDLPDGEYYKMSESLDFSHEGVRDFTFGVMQEAVGRFDVDGLEMCFRDQAYFPVNQAKGCSNLMTDLVRAVRAMLDEQGELKGRKLVLGARVFSTLEECFDLGLDVPTWISEGLIDYVSPADTMYTDFSVPVGHFAALTRDSQCMLYPGMLPWTSSRARNRLDQIPLSPSTCRAFAQMVYGAGGDGISSYNHFCTFWHAPFYPQSLWTLRQLRDPQKVMAGDRHYIFDPTWAGQAGFGGDGKCSTGVLKANKLVLTRDASDSADDYRFNLYEDLARTTGVTLLFRGFGLTEEDELDVRLNGHLIPDDLIGRSRASDSPVDWAHVRESGGQKIKCIPEQGRIDFRTEKDPPSSTRWFQFNDGIVEWGENLLNVRLVRSDPQASRPIIIDEIEVFTSPL